MIRKVLSSCLGIAALLGMSAATALAVTAPSPDKAIKGVYNCLLDGGFITRPGSRALMQFKVDGAGSVVSTAPGELAVTLGFFNTPGNPPNTHSFTGVEQTCDYTVSSGTYSLNTSGVGTLHILWTPVGNEAPCLSPNPITANYDILVTSPSSLTAMSTDLVTSNCSTDDDYPACGSSLAGSCQLQESKLP